MLYLWDKQFLEFMMKVIAKELQIAFLREMRKES